MKKYEGGEYTRISKQKARKMFANNEPFYMMACKLNPRGFGWFIPAKVVASEHQLDFDKFVNTFEYYNCTNNVMGKYAAFYVK